MLRASHVVSGAELRLACEGSPVDLGSCILNPSLSELEIKLLRHIGEKKWRGEVGMCLEFAGAKTSAQVEDALYRLVRLELVEWFGGEISGRYPNQGESPLRYRITEKGRRL